MINSRTYFLLDINLGPAALKYTRFCHLSCHRGADTWRRRCPVCPQPPPCCVTREDLLPQFPRTLVRGETWLGVWAEGRVRLSEPLGGKARLVPTPSAWVSILTLATRGGAPRDQGAGRGPRGTPWRCARCPERFQEDEGEGRGASAVALRPPEGIRPHGISGVLGTDVSVVAWEGRHGRAAGTRRRRLLRDADCRGGTRRSAEPDALSPAVRASPATSGRQRRGRGAAPRRLSRGVLARPWRLLR